MSVVTISKQSYSRGKEVAEKVAQKLGFECLSGEVLSEASDEFDVPEIELLRAVRDRPSILDQFTFGKERYSAYFQAALLHRLQSDNVVYHGLAGHYFVREVSHVLKVRIIGKLEDRVELVLKRESIFEQAASSMSGMPRQSPAGPRGRRMSKDDALRVLERSDEARGKWGLHLYGIDTHDPTLYDLVIHLDHLSIEEAAEVICFAARLDRFQATAQSRQVMDDLALAAQVRGKLIERYPRIRVAARQGVVHIALEGGTAAEEKAIRETVEQIPEVKQIETDLYPFTTPD
jgi:cytidylate kinase